MAVTKDRKIPLSKISPPKKMSFLLRFTRVPFDPEFHPGFHPRCFRSTASLSCCQAPLAQRRFSWSSKNLCALAEFLDNFVWNFVDRFSSSIACGGSRSEFCVIFKWENSTLGVLYFLFCILLIDRALLLVAAAAWRCPHSCCCEFRGTVSKYLLLSTFEVFLSLAAWFVC
jgi:hypothetical protein